MLKPPDQNLRQVIEQSTCPSSEMGLLLLLGFAILTVLAVGPPAVESQGSLIPLTNAEQQECVDRHNYYRRLANPPANGMKKLFWNEAAAVNAGKWAVQCKWAHSPQEQRNLPTCRCGESLFKGNYKYTVSTAVDYWYDENKLFVYGKGPTTKPEDCAHYTQMMWGSTSAIGCAKAQCGADIYFVVQYCTAGNIDPQRSQGFIYDSGPSCSQCPDKCDNKLCTNSCLYEDMDPANCPTYAFMCGKNSNDNEKMINNMCNKTCKCT